MQSQSWGEWLDEKLWDAERKAKNAWWRARTEWYRGTDRLADLFRREGPEGIRTLREFLTGAQRNYDQFRRGVPEAARAIEELRSKRYAPSPRPRRRRPQAEPAEE